MPEIVHIKDLNKFRSINYFHVKLINPRLKPEDDILFFTTKDIELATSIAQNTDKCAKNDRIIVTRETIIQMY